MQWHHPLRRSLLQNISPLKVKLYIKPIQKLKHGIVEPQLRSSIQARASNAESAVVGAVKMKVSFPDRMTNTSFLRALYGTIAPHSKSAYHKMLVEPVKWTNPLPSSVSIAKWPAFHYQLVDHILHFNMCFAWLRRDFDAEEDKARRSKSHEDPKIVIGDEPGEFFRQKDGHSRLGLPRAPSSTSVLPC